MAETYAFGSTTIKDLDGNVVTIKGISQNDLEKIKTNITETKANTQAISELKNKVEQDSLGRRRLAYKDYRQEPNQTEMVQGVYYMVPVNATDEFVEFDPNTGKPKTEQTTSDKKVAKYLVVFKDNLGSVSTLGEIDQQPDFADFAKIAGTNAFTGTNSFTTAPTLVGNTQTADTVGDDDLATGKTVKEVQALAKEKISLKIQATKPEVGEMTAGVLYAYVAEDLLTGV